MSLVSISADIAPLFEKPSAESQRIDEVLYGMSAQLLQSSESGWSYLRCEYGAEGYTPTACLQADANVAAAWRKYKKMTVLAPYIDVQKQPHSEAARLGSVPRGGIVVPLGTAGTDGWQKVGLVDGAVGYTRASYLGEHITTHEGVSPEDMRWNLVETALSYNGSAWRSGGRTPLGIDAAGLAAMTYLMNGVLIPRAALQQAGGALRRIDTRQMEEGDLLFFCGSVGVYIGDSRFIHATDIVGGEGVAVNSLRPKDEDYRGDLASHILAVCSLY